MRARVKASQLPVTTNATGRIVTLFAIAADPLSRTCCVGAKLTVMVHVAFTATGDRISRQRA